MPKGTRISIHEQIAKLDFLSNRTPEMADSGGASRAFAELSEYRNGAIYVGHYSGNSEWERHPNGDEIVLVLEGETTIILLQNGKEESSYLGANELYVGPCNTWHRFQESRKLQVMTVTPQPTDHSVEVPKT